MRSLKKRKKCKNQVWKNGTFKRLSEKENPGNEPEQIARGGETMKHSINFKKKKKEKNKKKKYMEGNSQVVKQILNNTGQKNMYWT